MSKHTYDDHENERRFGSGNPSTYDRQLATYGASLTSVNGRHRVVKEHGAWWEVENIASKVPS